MSKHFHGKYFTYERGKVKVQRPYEAMPNGTVTFEVTGAEDGNMFRLILLKDDEVVYDRELYTDQIDAHHFNGPPKTSNNLLNAAYIGSLWNHRILHLMYDTNKNGGLYKAAVAICHSVSGAMYELERLGEIKTG